ncbi:MAG: tetratricopeptide repeat protein [Xenococcaceae cyanobacterium]
MSKQYKEIELLAAVVISLSLTTAGYALAGNLPSQPRSKQLIEGPYTENLQAGEFFQLGVKHYQRGNFKEAEKAMLQALRFDPSMAMAYYLLGNALLGQGENENAIAQYRKAIRLEPKMLYAYNNLGVAFYRQGRYSEAIAEYEDAIFLDPKFGKAFYNMGLAFEKSDQYNKAILFMQRAKYIFLDSGEREKAKEVNQYVQCQLVRLVSLHPARFEPWCQPPLPYLT